MAKILNHCPTCHSNMEVTQLSCTSCETVVLGRFEPCRFCNLNDADLAFLESFLRNRGNVKDMERELGISYWTIRNQINELLETLGLAPQPDQEAMKSARKDILAKLQAGEIDPDTASRMLDELP